MTITANLITAEELLTLSGVGRCELIQGEIIQMSPAGAEHGSVTSEISFLVGVYVRQRQLGVVFAAETGFTIERNPDTTRAPDVAFVAKDRLPKPLRSGFFDGPPDLAVEVVSPSDVQSEVRAKVEQWLAAGAVSVWVVDPPNRSIDVYRKGNQALLYRAGDKIVDEPTLPGFTLNVDDVFRQP